MKIVKNIISHFKPSKQDDPPTLNLSDMPADILFHIFVHCGPKATAKLGSTSKAFNKEDKKSDAWNYFGKDYFPLEDFCPKQNYLISNGGIQTFKIHGKEIFYEVKVNTTADGLKGIHLKELLKIQHKVPYESMQLEYNTHQITDSSDVKSLRIDNQYYIYIKTDK